MILHDITLSGFRTFADKVHVGPFASNITIIHAPNGTGKSTLLDGFYHGLLESHSVSGGKAETMMLSGGRDLVPTVCVDFETGGVRYRLEKRFLKRSEAKLSRFENGAYLAMAEGDAATAFPRKLLLAKSSARGAIKREEHFGLGAILWASQGRIEVDAISGDALGAARSLLGGFAAAAGAGDIAVAEMAKHWFTKFYTRGNNESTAMGSANLPELRKQLADAEQRFFAAQTAHGEVDRLRVRFDETAAEKLRYTMMEAALDEELCTLAAIVKAYEAASLQMRDADATCAAAEERYSQATTARAEIERLRIANATAEKEEIVHAAARDRAVALEEAAREHLAREQAGCAAVAAAVEAAEAGEAAALDAAALIAARRDAVVLAQRLAEVEQLHVDIGIARTERIELNAPSATQMRNLRKFETSMSEARAKLDAAVLHVVFSPAKKHAVTVVTGTLEAQASSSQKDSVEVSGSPVVEFAIDGVGTIRAHGPSASADAIRVELAAFEAKFTKLVQPFGTKDMRELERRAERLTALDHRVVFLESRLLDRTNDYGTVEDIREAMTAGVTLLGRLEAAHPEWLHAEPDAEALVTAAKKALTAARSARSETASAAKVASAAYESSTKARLSADASFNEAAAQTLRARTRLDGAENDGLDDARRTTALEELGLTAIDARRNRDNARATIAKFPEDPRLTYGALERRRDAARDERVASSEQHAEIRALLDAASRSGSYETMAVAESNVVLLRARVQRTESEARAAKLLHDTFLGVETDREAAILAPVRERTAELYGRMTAAEAPVLHFNDDLTFESLESGGVRYAQTLSGGEREQLHMLTRLALADLITDGERQLVILDDSLTNTDPFRFGRFRTLIEEYSQTRMQFVIATCDKARYLGMKGATFIDLEAAKRPQPVSAAS